MGGCNNALAWGVGATEYANMIYNGFTFVEVPEAIRFELVGELPPGATAKDVMLYILLEFARPQHTLNRVMEFTGPGLATALAGRAGDARQHGDRMHRPRRRRRRRRADLRVDRRPPPGRPRWSRCAPARWRPTRTRSIPAGCT